MCATRPGLLPHLYETKEGCSGIQLCASEPGWHYLSILDVPDVWNNNLEAGKPWTDVGKLQGSTAAVWCPVENAGGAGSPLPGHTKTYISLKTWILRRAETMWTTVPLSLCPIHLRARECDSGCCNIDHEAPSCLIGSETHRLRSSAAAFCIFCSSPSTAPCPCTCSPPHTRTLHPTCLCSSESPSGEILGQNKNKNDNRLTITHMKRWRLFQVITETQKWQKTRSSRKNESQFLYLVCSLWSRGYICLPGSARWWNFLKDTPRTLCKTSDTHLAEDSNKAKWAPDDSVHVNAGCGYATLSLCRLFF